MRDEIDERPVDRVIGANVRVNVGELKGKGWNI